MNLRLPALAFAMLTLLAACDAEKQASAPPVAVSVPPASASVSPPAVASAAPAAPRGKQVADGHLRCLASKDGASYAVDLDPESMKGTFTIDGSATRRFDVQGEPWKGLTLLTFKGYHAGDTKPASEKLTEKSRVVTLLPDDTNPSAFTALYFDADFQPPGVGKLAQVPCGK